MSELNAAIGIEQVKKIPYFLKKRKQNFDRLSFLLKNLKNVRVIDSSKEILKNSHYCLAILLDKKISKLSGFSGNLQYSLQFQQLRKSH